jgi:hypothetical protein
VEFGAFFAAVIAMAYCSRKAMQKSSRGSDSRDFWPTIIFLVFSPNPELSAVISDCRVLNFWIRYSNSEGGALGTSAPHPICGSDSFDFSNEGKRRWAAGAFFGLSIINFGHDEPLT